MTTEAPLACRQETDKHQKQNSLKMRLQNMKQSRILYHEIFSTEDVLSWISYPRNTKSKSLLRSQSRCESCSLPTQTSPPTRPVPPPFPQRPSPLSFLWTCLGSFSTALDTPPKNTFTNWAVQFPVCRLTSLISTKYGLQWSTSRLRGTMQLTNCIIYLFGRGIVVVQKKYNLKWQLLCMTNLYHFLSHVV